MTKVTYNRNGSGGDSFYTVTMNYGDVGTIIAVVPTDAYDSKDSSRVYVVTPMDVTNNFDGPFMAHKIFSAIKNNND